MVWRLRAAAAAAEKEKQTNKQKQKNKNKKTKTKKKKEKRNGLKRVVELDHCPVSSCTRSIKIITGVHF